MRMQDLAFALFALFLTTGASLACLIEPKPRDWKRPAFREGQSCNFEDRDYASGAAGTIAWKLSLGLTVQRVDHSTGCTLEQELLIADCNSRELIGVFGREDPWLNDDYGAGKGSYVERLFSPYGAIHLTRQTTFDDVLGVAQRKNYRHTTTTDYISQLKRNKSRFDPYCGCRVLFPGTIGEIKSREFDQTARN